MAMFRKLFYRKPPDGLLEICERVYVFDCCFTIDGLEEQDYKGYVGGIIAQLRENYPNASILAFNFREGENQSQIANAFIEYDMTLVEYPRHYEGCPLLPMEVIHHFLKSCESWLSLGLQNVLLLHCELGGWPVLAFMLAELLIYRKHYSGEVKTLDMVYRQAPRELLHLLSPLNPIPSQLRYLQYVSRRNVATAWPPLDRALALDCVIIRTIPNFDGEGGCRPIFRIYGQNPSLVSDRAPKLLFATPKKSKANRRYKQEECELVKIDINCHIQGDVVLECINLHDDSDREAMMFRVMFNTAFIRSNILMLTQDEIDVLWDAKNLFPKDFRAEVLFSEIDTVPSEVPMRRSCFEAKDGLPVEAFAKAHEMFSDVDWLVLKGDAAGEVVQPLAASNINRISESYSDAEKSKVNKSIAAPDAKSVSTTDSTSENQSNFSKQLSQHADVGKTQVDAHHTPNEIGESVSSKQTFIPPSDHPPPPSNSLPHQTSDAKNLSFTAKLQSDSNALQSDVDTDRVHQSETFPSTSESQPTNDGDEPKRLPLTQATSQSPVTPLSEDKAGIQSGFPLPLVPQESSTASTSPSKDESTDWLGMSHVSAESSRSHDRLFKEGPPKLESPPSTAYSTLVVPEATRGAIPPPPPPHQAKSSTVDMDKPSSFGSPPLLETLPSDPNGIQDTGSKTHIPNLSPTTDITLQTISPKSSPKLHMHDSISESSISASSPVPSAPPPPPSWEKGNSTHGVEHPYPLSTTHLTDSPSSACATCPPPPPPPPLPPTFSNEENLTSYVMPSHLLPSTSDLADSLAKTSTTSLPPHPSPPVPPRSALKEKSTPKVEPPHQPSTASHSTDIPLSKNTVCPLVPPSPSPQVPANNNLTVPSSPLKEHFASVVVPPSPSTPRLGDNSISKYSRSSPVSSPKTPNERSSVVSPPPPPLPSEYNSVFRPPQSPPGSSPKNPNDKSSGGGSSIKSSTLYGLAAPPSLPPPPSNPQLRDTSVITHTPSTPPPPPPLEPPKEMSSGGALLPPPLPHSGQGLGPANTLTSLPPPSPPPPTPVTSTSHGSVTGSPIPSVPPPPKPPNDKSSGGGSSVKSSTLYGLAAPPPPSNPQLRDTSVIRHTLSTPRPPPPKETSSGGAPLPPPLPYSRQGLGPANASTSSSPPPPPPPPTPAPTSHGSIPGSPPVPSIPPPPIPSKELGGLSSSIPGGNLSSCPSPPPPSIPPPGAKGKSLLSRGATKNIQAKKLKPLHWLKMSRAVSGSLWAEAQKSGEAAKAPEIDMAELESLFSAAVPSPDESSSRKSGSRGSMGQKSEKVQLIDHRRAYNCEIMLSKVKIPLPDMLSSMLTLEDSALDVDQVENLVKFCPTKDEMELLKGYKGDKEKLGKCEQFFLELMQVPRVEYKLKVFSFKIQFHTQASDLRNSLNIVNSAADQIRGSSKLKRIMQTILSLGNALNQGTARGSAVGFRLDSLLKLTETRARNNKLTLMHYLCKVLFDKLPELLDFWEELSSTEPASKIQLKFLAEEMQTINKGLEKVVQELSMSESDGPVSEQFCKALKEFLCYAEGEVRSLASLYAGVGRNVDSLILYFGEDPSRCQFEQVISTLLNFVRMFKKAHEENLKQQEIEKKKAEKEATEKAQTNASNTGQLLESSQKMLNKRTIDAN